MWLFVPDLWRQCNGSIDHGSRQWIKALEFLTLLYKSYYLTIKFNIATSVIIALGATILAQIKSKISAKRKELIN
jgi:hypothetical protein